MTGGNEVEAGKRERAVPAGPVRFDVDELLSEVEVWFGSPRVSLWKVSGRASARLRRRRVRRAVASVVRHLPGSGVAA
jgi:hypothetical protein